MKDEPILMGIDIGSTTAKIVLVRDDEPIHKDYRRHNADIVTTLSSMLRDARSELGNQRVSAAVTGSAGMGLSERFSIPFVQEVIATVEVVKKFYPSVRTLIDVGGEDSKMIFFDERLRPDIRMNGNCAGGTGAFIDQMATLLNVELSDLESLAEKARRVHPIASRCGVFAKTDVQNLLSREVPKADIAASIFHAVALQVMSTLSRGYDPISDVIFCGGPFTFMPKLKDSFMEVMEITGDSVVEPSHPEMLPAIGTAIYREGDRLETSLEDLIETIEGDHTGTISISKRLDPLFKDEMEFKDWERRRMTPVRRGSLKDLDGSPCHIGIDSGSTTTKVVLISPEKEIVYEFYTNNRGDPIGAAKEGLERLKDKLYDAGAEVVIAGTAVTGYGEDLIRAAYGMDEGIVETLAHFRAAKEFMDEVSFILDIGGQDMKAIFIQNGIINNIEINEACSSGCGSFIETFAASLGFRVEDFAGKACLSQGPSDLGTRCTVFMNSKVKQALREGASVEDISGGLAYSVIKNCLHKVLKIKDMAVLGDHIIVQGGTFRNPAVHRALEKILEHDVVCSDVPELMGAYGAALFSADSRGDGAVSGFVGLENLEEARRHTKREIRCSGCENRCSVTQMTFSNGQRFYTGNKCERIFTNRGNEAERGYNGPDRKLELLFDREMVPEGKPRMRLGIPRVLNMYENFPFWCTLLRGSGFEVVLSPSSSPEMHEKGTRTIMSENICYPAKLTNGHILQLIGENIDRLFYPMVIYEEGEYGGSLNTFNCPIVSGYPDVIKSSISPEGKYGIPFDTPTITFSDRGLLRKGCWKYLKGLGVSRRVFNRAFGDALASQLEFKEKLREETAQLMERAERAGELVVLLLGRPYHIDPLINHKIPEMITGLGAHVITEDSIPHGGDEDISNIQVLTQWEYPNRIYNAVNWALSRDNVEVVQLNSFGCGPDALVCDEARVLLQEVGKNYTLIRIDEVSSPGSVKLRLRSMMESLNQRGMGKRSEPIPRITTPPFQKEDRIRNVIIPSFAPFFDPLLAAAFQSMGYSVESLPPPDRDSVNVGLKYTNNEICYPAIIVIGDIIKALQTGKYDLDTTAAGITQTGGQCRASSYVSLLKKALVAAGFENIPVVTVTTSGQTLNYQPGVKFDYMSLARKAVVGMMYADSIMMMYYSTAVREKRKGETWRLSEEYLGRAADLMRGNREKEILGLLEEAVDRFNSVDINCGEFPVVGYVGEIYVKYNPFGNQHLVDWMVDNGVEVVVPHIFEFFAQYYLNDRFMIEANLRRRGLFYLASYPIEWYVNRHLKRYEKVRRKYRYYRHPHDPSHLSRLASRAVSLADQFGEGWLIPAEISSFSDYGIKNVLCVQPFGCIANHVIGKGIEKRLKELHPEMNILYLDMDAGSSEVNLLNRLNFLVRSARADMG